MDIKHLAYVLAVAEAKSISHAAQQLNVSQPPLTRLIRRIEQDLGHDLFLRTAKGVELTDVGRAFVRDAGTIVNIQRRMLENCRRIGLGLSGTFDVGIYGSTAYAFIPGVIRTFGAQHPEIKVNLQALGHSELLEALRNRTVMAGFDPFYDGAPDMRAERITSEAILAALPEKHPLARHDAIDPADLATLPLVLMSAQERFNFLHFCVEMFRSAGGVPHVTHEVTEPMACLSLVAAGFGFALVAESSAKLPFLGVAYRPFKVSAPPRLDLDCVYLQDNDSPLLSAFLKAVRANRTATPLDPSRN